MKNRKPVLVSIITVVYNNVASVRTAIESVLSQDYQHIEYIVVDGGSTDGTLEILNEYSKYFSVFISEPDNGIYDALNKGIQSSSGDIIATLHSDDKYLNKSVVTDYALTFSLSDVEICFSDLIIVKKETGRIFRYYRAGFFKKWLFRIGWMPPHPTCFIKKTLFEEFGLYSTSYKIAGDFDLLVRMFYGRDINWSYLDIISIEMSNGGASSSDWKSKKIIAQEINKILQENNIFTLSILQIVRYFIRLLELLTRPKKY